MVAFELGPCPKKQRVKDLWFLWNWTTCDRPREAFGQTSWPISQLNEMLVASVAGPECAESPALLSVGELREVKMIVKTLQVSARSASACSYLMTSTHSKGKACTAYTTNSDKYTHSTHRSIAAPAGQIRCREFYYPGEQSCLLIALREVDN